MSNLPPSPDRISRKDLLEENEKLFNLLKAVKCRIDIEKRGNGEGGKFLIGIEESIKIAVITHENNLHKYR